MSRIDNLLAEAEDIISQENGKNVDGFAQNQNRSVHSSNEQSIDGLLDKNAQKKNNISSMAAQLKETPRNGSTMGQPNYQPLTDDNNDAELNFIQESSSNKPGTPLIEKQLKIRRGNTLRHEGERRRSNRRAMMEDFDEDSDDKELMQTLQTEAEMKFQNTAGEMVAYKPNPRLKNYKNVFQDLLKQTTIRMMNPIVSMIISADSKRAVALSQEDDNKYIITQYCLETYQETFNEVIGGQQSDYIKCKDIEQLPSGDKFLVAYNNDGVFKVRIFGKEPREQADMELNEVNVNELLKLNNFTMCNHTSFDPFINAIFIDEDKLYICLFQNLQKTHWHFFYSISQQKIIGQPVSYRIECSKKNHPQKSFYNSELREVYTIYRQSQAFIIQEDYPEAFRFDASISDQPGLAMGQMYLVFNKALIVSCSNDIYFFKMEHSVETDEREFKCYQSIMKVGQNTIYFINGNVRIQIVTAEKIYYYLIDRETLRADLQYVMFNYMKCSQIMIGPRVRYAVTYKAGEQSFDLYRRKYVHGFKVPVITQESFEGGICLDLPKVNSFVVAKLDQVRFFNNETFKERKDVKLDIELLAADTREPNQVIQMVKSQSEDLIAIITGKILIMNEQKMNQLYIFKKRMVEFGDDIDDQDDQIDGEQSNYRYDLLQRIKIRDIPIFEKQVCIDFHFFEEKEKEPSKILFCKKNVIFSFDFNTQELATVFQMKEPFKRQPLQFEPNHNQTVFLVSSSEDGAIIDLKQEEGFQVTNFQTYFSLQEIRSITYEPDEQKFYVVANKYRQKLGFFVLKIDAKDPSSGTFLVKWKNKLDIATVCMHILKYPDLGYSELVMGFKSIYINVYNLFCIDISQEGAEPIIFRHESFQLWESDCFGILLNNKSSDFITLNKQGMWVTSFGSTQSSQDDKGLSRKRVIVDDVGQERMLHTLESCNYLQLEKENYLHFDCQQQQSQVITVVQEYQKGMADADDDDPEMAEWKLYNINLQELNLRELLLCQSLSMCKTLSEMYDFVQSQPSPDLFFKSTFEFDFGNLISILSFDSRSIEYLLSDKHIENFPKLDYPLFYRNKIQKGPRKLGKFFYRSAVDSALRNNQTTSVECIIKHIVKHQNHFVSSWLFKSNIPDLLETGIQLENLLDSNVFKFSFDFDEWPSIHQCDKDEMRAYSYNIFEIRKHYKDVFPEVEYSVLDPNNADVVIPKKMNKIKYSVNLLPIIGSHYQKQIDEYSGTIDIEFTKDDIFTTGIFSDADDLDIFRSRNVQNLIDFKWHAYGFNFHLVSTIVQFLYLALLFIYVYNQYIKFDAQSDQNWLSLIFLIFVAYPCVLESLQMCKIGFIDYMTDPDNWLDITFIYGSIAMAIIHYIYGPQHIASKFSIVIILLSAFRQSLKLLRIFSSLSTLIAMLTSVIWQLRIFMTFFIILLIFFGSMISVLGIGNIKVQDGFRLVFYDEENKYLLSDEAPTVEFRKINLFVANVIQMFKISMGDFAIIDSAKYLQNASDMIVFWILWFLMVLALAVVFLNFVVAEASETYNDVSERITEFIYQQKSDLINDAESIIPNKLKKIDHFPQYIVARKVET